MAEEIQGYNKLSPTQVTTVNTFKAREAQILQTLDMVANQIEAGIMADPHWVAEAKKHFQMGFMCAVRSITQPVGIPPSEETEPIAADRGETF